MRTFANPADHAEWGRLWWNLFPPSVLAARRQALHAQLFIPRVRFHFPTTAAKKNITMILLYNITPYISCLCST
jgi:hypothetical protein